MTDAFVALLQASVERAVDVYARQLESGRCDATARSYATAYTTALVEGYLEGFAKGDKIGHLQERARLKALHDSASAHGPEAQRWVMAIELGSDADDSATPSEFTLSN